MMLSEVADSFSTYTAWIEPSVEDQLLFNLPKVQPDHCQYSHDQGNIGFLLYWFVKLCIYSS